MIGAAAAAAALFWHASDEPVRAPRAAPTLVIARAPERTIANPSGNPDVARVPRIDAPGVERALATAASGTRDLVLERLLVDWMADDPPAAVRFAELETEPFLREVALRTVAQTWALADRGAAAQWATSLDDIAERDRVIEHVALVMAGADARAALELLARRSAREPHDGACAGVLASWAAQDFTTAQSWVEAQPPGPARDELVQRLVHLRARSDPQAAAWLATALVTDEAARSEAYASIVQPWLERDPDAARAWAAAIGGEPHRRLAAELALAAPRRPD